LTIKNLGLTQQLGSLASAKNLMKVYRLPMQTQAEQRLLLKRSMPP
jgi:hypothetical protein